MTTTSRAWLNGALADSRHAIRRALHSPGAFAFRLAIVVVLATLATVAVAVVEAVAFRPAPFPHPETLVELRSANKQTPLGVPNMPGDLVALWQEQTEIFSGVGASAIIGTVLTGNSTEQRTRLFPAFITPNLLDILAVSPALGRGFTPADIQPGARPVVLISDGLWRRRFGADPKVIGVSFALNNIPNEIIGVLPDSFGYPSQSVDIWKPLDLRNVPSRRLLDAIARAKSREVVENGSLRSRVESIGPAIMSRSATRWPFSTATIVPFGQLRIAAVTRSASYVLLITMAVVVCGAWASLSGLAMNHWLAGATTFTTQIALGATRVNLLRQSLAEQLLLGLIGLGLAAPLSYFGVTGARVTLPDFLVASGVAKVSWSSWSISALLITAAAIPLAAGVLPLIATYRLSSRNSTGKEGRRTTTNRQTRFVQRALVIAQIAAAVVLLFNGCQLLRSFVRLQAVDRGFASDELVFADWSYPSDAFPTSAGRRAFEDRLEQNLESRGAHWSLASGLPPSASIRFATAFTAGQEGNPSARLRVPLYSVQPQFFELARIPITQGTAFTNESEPTDVMISEPLAATLWGAESPVMKLFKFDDDTEWMRVVGVVRKIHGTALNRDDTGLQLFRRYEKPVVSPGARPSTSTFSGSTSVVVSQAALDPASLKALLRELDDRIIVTSQGKIEDRYQEGVVVENTTIVVVSVISFLTLALATLSVYGLWSGIVKQRASEFGIRAALGASRVAIARHVLGAAGVVAVLGIISGLILSRWLDGVLRSVIVGLTVTDSVPYIASSTVILFVALAASIKPALSAARTNPAELLRNQ